MEGVMMQELQPLLRARNTDCDLFARIATYGVLGCSVRREAVTHDNDSRISMRSDRC